MTTPARVGIYAPYTSDESTRLGLDLMHKFASLGLPTTWLSWGRRTGGLDPLWDHTIRTERKHSQDFNTWVKTLTHLVWFDVQPHRLRVAEQAGVHNTLVPLWQRLKRDQICELQRFSRILCPSAASYRWVLDYASDARIRCAAWSCGLELNKLPCASEPASNTVAVWLDAVTAGSIGINVFQTLARVLCEIPQLRLMIMCSGGWSRIAKAGLASLVQAHPDRMLIFESPNQYHRLAILRSCDWLFFPGVHESVGHIALEAAASRCPTIAFDVPPVSEIARHKSSGVLISCELEFNPLKVPRPLMCERFVFDTLATTVTDHALRQRILSKDWHIVSRTTQFDAAWRSVLDVTNSLA